MVSYLKCYSFVYEIHVLHTAISMFVFQEYDIELGCSFYVKEEKQLLFCERKYYANFTREFNNTKWLDSCPDDNRTVS
jgi:hypothetical protein